MSSVPNESSSGGDSAASTQSSVIGFLDSLGSIARIRPEPHFGRATIGIGGALIPIGLAFLFAGDSESTTGLYVATILTVGLALIARLKNVVPEDLVGGTSSAGVVGLVLFFATLIGDTEMDPGLGLLIAGVAHVALWASPGFRGSSIFLGAGAFVMLLGLADIFTGNNEIIENDFASDLPIDVTTYFARAGVAYLILGALLIGIVYFLDKRGFSAVGTALVPAGLLAVVVGVFLTVQDMDNAGVGVLFFLIGLGLSLAGHNGGRRGLTWWGTSILGVGVVAFFALAIKPESNSSIGVTVLVAALLLAGGPRIAKAVGQLNSES